VKVLYLASMLLVNWKAMENVVGAGGCGWDEQPKRSKLVNIGSYLASKWRVDGSAVSPNILYSSAKTATFQGDNDPILGHVKSNHSQRCLPSRFS
jgi:hypothetical protein